MQFSGQYSGPGSIPGMGIFSGHVQRRSRNMFHSFHNRVLTEDTLGGHSFTFHPVPFTPLSSPPFSLSPHLFHLLPHPLISLLSLLIYLTVFISYSSLLALYLFVFFPSAFTLPLFHHIVPPSPLSHHLLLCNTLPPLIALSPLLLPPSLDILAWRHSVK